MLPENKLYHVHHGNCIPHMMGMEPESMDFSAFSPPFPSVFSYSSSGEDIGNAEDLDGEAKLHFSFFFKALRRVMKPGRVVIVHCQQIARLKRSGEQGIYDFRGLLIRLGQRAGFIYEYDWLIPKNPQLEAIRTKSHQLAFAGMERDRAKCRGALGDYLIKFVAPGDNAVPIDSKEQVSRNDWIEWAACYWTDIRMTRTLNVKEGRAEDDTKHICPLALDIINRAIRLYSNPGEIVFSPFAGIGSEGYEALKLGRRFYGCELKPEYYRAALVNLERAIAETRADTEMLLPGFAVA